MKPKIIDGHLMQRISECRFIFGHFVRSFLYPAMYKSASAERIAILVSVL